MKRCPSCDRSYTDTTLNFCLEDGTPLVPDAPPPSDLNATVRYPAARDTSEPPPTEIYRPDSPLISTPPPPATIPPRPAPPPPQQWTPTPSAQTQKKKSNAVWWILGGLAAVGVIGVGIVVMIIALASMSSNNSNNGNVANRNENRNANVAANTNANASNSNARASNSLVDNFTESKWGTGESRFGKIWYADDEYHMASKDKTFIVMYAPNDDYSTEDATVKVTARSVDGTSPASGFGLMVHCALSKAKHLEDYALLIFPSDDPEYEIIMHKDGNQSSLVSKTKSSAIRPGTSPNQLEIRIKGTEISFYANGQFLTKIEDSQNYKRGRAGLYTSDVTEVAFDDLEINR